MLVGLKKRKAVLVTVPTPDGAVGGEGVAGTDAVTGAAVVSGAAVTSGVVDVGRGAIVGEVGCSAAGDCDFPFAGDRLVTFVRLALGALSLGALCLDTLTVWRWRAVCRF
jgi:hypothetical protein